MTTERGRIIGASRDVTNTTDPDDQEALRRNQSEGQLSGQRRIRIRYRRYVTRWFDYFRVAVPELRELASGAGWEVREALTSDDDSDVYVAILEKSA